MTIKKITIGLVGWYSNDEYLKNRGQVAEDITIKWKDIKGGGISSRDIALKEKKFVDTMEVYPVTGDHCYSIGYIDYE